MLNTLLQSDKIGDNEDEGDALTKVYKVITRLSPQVPDSHRGDAHKIKFLRSAVIGSEWATEPLSRIVTHGLTFQQLYGELEATHQIYNDAKFAILRDKASSSKTDLDHDE